MVARQTRIKTWAVKADRWEFRLSMICRKQYVNPTFQCIYVQRSIADIVVKVNRIRILSTVDYIY